MLILCRTSNPLAFHIGPYRSCASSFAVLALSYIRQGRLREMQFHAMPQHPPPKEALAGLFP